MPVYVVRYVLMFSSVVHALRTPNRASTCALLIELGSTATYGMGLLRLLQRHTVTHQSNDRSSSFTVPVQST